MNVAEAVAKASHDTETQVGALLINVKTGAILSQGFNGFVRHASDDQLPTKRPDKYEFMIHAEQNLICNCAKHGVSMDDCVVVCTYTPCAKCMRALWQCGIREVYAHKVHRTFAEVKKMKDLQVHLKGIEIEGEHYNVLTYNTSQTLHEYYIKSVTRPLF